MRVRDRWWGSVGMVALALAAGCDGGAVTTDGSSGTDGGSGGDGGGLDGGAPDAGSIDAPPPPDGAPSDAGGSDAGAPTSALITAAAGGEVGSADGIFTLYVPPGALASDTTISVRIVPASDVPADVTATDPVSAIYDVQPDGLTFSIPAIVTYRYATAPAGTIDPSGDVALLRVHSRSSDGTMTPWDDALALYESPALTVSARVDHLSLHWVGKSFFDVGMDLGSATQPLSIPWAARVVLRVPTPFSGDLRITGYAYDLLSVRVLPYVGGMSVEVPSAAGGATGSSFRIAGASLTPGDYDVRPAPTWECVRPGRFIVLANVQFNGNTAGTVLEGRCYGGGPSHAVMLSNLDTCTRTAGVLSCAPSTGATANVIHADAATAARFTMLDEANVVFDGVPAFTSSAGASPIVLSNGTFDVTATYATDRYAITGLARPWPDTGAGMLTVTAPGASPAVDPITVAAPDALPAGATIFGTPNDWATEVRIPDGTFDAMFVYAVTADARSGVLREVYAADMTLDGADRVAPILPPTVVTELATRGIAPTTVYVGFYRETWHDTLFAGLGPVPVQAGRLFQVAVADLAPPPPPPAIDSQPCPPPAHLFPPRGTFDAPQVIVCMDATSCRVTNDYMLSTPAAATECALADRVLRVTGGSAPSAYPQNAWTMVWATTAIVRSATAPPIGADASIWLDRASDGARYRVDYRAGVDTIAVSSVAPFTGVLPPFGAAYACDALPHTFVDPVAPGPFELVAQLCYEPPGLFAQCDVQGNIAATPEDERCVRYALGLGTDTTTGLPIALANPGASTRWTFESTSAGTNGTTMVTDIPRGIDVTFVLVYGTRRLSVVARWEASGVTVQSVDVL